MDDQRENSNASSQQPWSAFIRSRLDHVWDIGSRNQADRVADACQAIDQELAALHLAMYSLRRRRNSLAPISRLPPETLLHIFWLCGDQEPFGDQIRSEGRRRKFSLGWITITHVCSYWRDISLQHPILWNKPVLVLGPIWMRLMLSRAKAMPWFGRFDLFESKGEIRDIIVDHISNSRRLSLSGVASDLDYILEKLVSPAGILECLRLDARYGCLTLLDGCSDMFPRLRYLYFTNIRIQWSLPFLRNLTCLEVELAHPGQNDLWRGSSYGNAVSFYDQFFFALDRLPTLEALVLKNALPSREESVLGSHVATLSHLRTLSLHDEITRCFDIFSQLRFPSSCQLSLKCSRGAAYLNIEDILPILRDHVRGSDKPPLILSLDVERAYFRLAIWGSHEMLADAPDFHAGETPDLLLRMPHPNDPTLDPAAPCQALCDALPLDDLRVLLVNYRHDSSNAWIPRRWIDMFGRCRSVEHVHITGKSAAFVAALRLPVQDHSASVVDVHQGPASQPLFLQDLQSLTLMDVQFSARIRSGMTVYKSLYKSLAARKQVTALPTIRICSSCRNGAKYSEKLRKLSEDVIAGDFLLRILADESDVE